MKMRPTILTRSGWYFDFTVPNLQAINIEDIAHALANTCRFGGHTSSFYSVAQHSVLVSYVVPLEHRFYALMHDAAEAYLGDVTSPLKQLLPEYKRIEHTVEQAIRRRFNLCPNLPSAVKDADLMLLATERRDLMPEQNEVWGLLDGVSPLLEAIRPLGSVEAKVLFMDEFYALKAACDRISVE